MDEETIIVSKTGSPSDYDRFWKQVKDLAFKHFGGEDFFIVYKRGDPATVNPAMVLGSRSKDKIAQLMVYLLLNMPQELRGRFLVHLADQRDNNIETMLRRAGINPEEPQSQGGSSNVN